MLKVVVMWLVLFLSIASLTQLWRYANRKTKKLVIRTTTYWIVLSAVITTVVTGLLFIFVAIF